jgi:GR25 family glycosyltransferase involved in LPS biosynthesis
VVKPGPLRIGASPPTSAIPFYCINLAHSEERRERMTRRFDELGLLGQVQFIRAIESSSSSVDQHMARAAIDWAPDRRRSEIACLLSHLLALDTFLKETSPATPSAIIFEDDVLLHREWHAQLHALLENLPEGAPLCSLGYEVVSWDGFDWAGRDPDRKNLMLMNPKPLWGAHAYWTSREHAQEALEHYEEIFNDPRILSEFIVKWPGAYVSFPPLVIEDGMPSTIRTEGEMGVHRMIHHGWGVENYGSGNPDDHMLKRRTDTDQTVCLCMIVRNEAHVIGRLAKSLEGLIDCWVICDTGSTDGTPAAVESAFGDLPGELFHDEWRDYGTNRTLMLERAQGKADYLLILDADQTVRVTCQLGSLDADAYSLLVDEPTAHWVPRLVRSGLPWRYVGAAHEYLTCDRPYRTEFLDGLVVQHHADGGNRPDKAARELELLERDLAQEPDNPRTIFYLAQTHREIGNDAKAIELYARRVELGGWPEEVFYSKYWHAELISHRDWDLGVSLLLDAWQYRPKRAEPLYALVQGFRARNQYRLAEMFGDLGMRLEFPDDTLFVHREPYDWGLVFEWSIAAYWTRNLKGALEGNEYLLAAPSVPPEVRRFAATNRERCQVALDLYESDDGQEVSLEALWVPTLGSLVEGTRIGQIELSLGRSWVLSQPSIMSEGDGFRLLARAVSSTATKGASDDEEPFFVDIELDADLSVRSATGLGNEPTPDGAVSEGSDFGRLVGFGGDRWLVFDVIDAAPPRSGRTAIARVAAEQFVDRQLLESPGSEGEDRGWIPVVRDDDLHFVTSLSPTMAVRGRPGSGPLTVVSTNKPSRSLAGERGSSQGVAVDGGVLAVTRVSSVGGTSEHRFVLLGNDFEVLATSPRFCFESPVGEVCVGLAVQGPDLVMSFDRGGAGAHVARLPYEGVRALLWPE